MSGVESSERAASPRVRWLLTVVAVLLLIAASALGAVDGRDGASVPVTIALVTTVVSLGYVTSALRLVSRNR